jgi:uncharacterized protein YkwD
MKRIIPIEGVTVAKRVLALVSCTAALASLTLVPAAAQAPTDEQLRALEAQLLVLVNQARVNAGHAPYTVSPQLSEAARRHSQDMATNNFFGSTGSDGSTPTTRIQDTGYQSSSLGESFVYGVATAEEALQAAGANILGGYAEIGVAVAYNANSDSGYYWTIDFGGVGRPSPILLPALEARLLDLINQARAQFRLFILPPPPLDWSNELAAAARRHSLDMATHDFVGSTGSDGSDPTTRIRDAGYQARSSPLIGPGSGELILPSAATAEEAMKSVTPNILQSSYYTEIGIAVAFSANTRYGYYWTLDYGRR